MQMNPITLAIIVLTFLVFPLIGMAPWLAALAAYPGSQCRANLIDKHTQEGTLCRNGTVLLGTSKLSWSNPTVECAFLEIECP